MLVYPDGPSRIATKTVTTRSSLRISSANGGRGANTESRRPDPSRHHGTWLVRCSPKSHPSTWHHLTDESGHMPIPRQEITMNNPLNPGYFTEDELSQIGFPSGKQCAYSTQLHRHRHRQYNGREQRTDRWTDGPVGIGRPHPNRFGSWSFTLAGLRGHFRFGACQLQP